MPRSRRARPGAHRLVRTALPVAVVSLALLTSGCGIVLDGLLSPDDAQRDEPGGEITQASDADVFSLAVGDCFASAALDDAAELESLPVIPCDDPHDAEIYAETTLPAGDFPGDDEISKTADDFCYAEFAEFVGVPFEESEHTYWPLTPTAQGWATLDDRVVQCVADTMGVDVTGTLAGTAS